MSYQVNPEDASFKEVINSFLYRTTEMTAYEMSFSYHLDTLWSLLSPYVHEDDNKKWREMCEYNDYQSWMNKLKLISLVLYKNGLLPQVDFVNRMYEANVIGKSLGVDSGLKSYKIDNVDMNMFIMRHLKYISYMTKNQRPYTMHVDALWNFLTPYITQEDYDNWVENNSTYGSDDSARQDKYRWDIEKLKILMTVMDRAGFLMEEGAIDNPEDRIKQEAFGG